MKERKIKYEPHPVSPERKAELRKQGFTIIDEKFKPESEKVKPKAKGRTNAPKVETPEDSDF